MEGQEEEIKDVFNVLDKEKTGGLDAKEVGRGLRALGLNPTDEELQKFLRESVFNTQDKMEFQEFFRVVQRCKAESITNKEDVRKFFKNFDASNQGTVDLKELRNAMCSGDGLTTEEFDAVAKDFDKESSGKVDIEQFLEGLFK